jgi:poly(A) polymerase
MKISGEWLTAPDLQRLLRGLGAAGFDTYLVGGCVRNALMGLPISDVDLASAALPENVTNVAVSLGFSVVPTGLDHGTVTIVTPSATYEITTFRRDLHSDGRHAQVAFSTAIADDAARRDFTMNALYATADGEVIDPLGGLPDALGRRVRFVGNPDDRITEDYLRILRYFRFCAVYADPDHGFDQDALAACAAHAEGIARLSRERVGQEMRKLLGANNPAPALAAMQAAGVLRHVLQGSVIEFLAPLIHLEAGFPLPWIIRLAVLGGENSAQSLRLSRGEEKTLHIVTTALGKSLSPAALGHLHGPDLARGIITAKSAMFGTDLPHNWQADAQRGASAACPVSAADFMPALSGPALGAALARAKNHWLASDLRATRDELLNP